MSRSISIWLATALALASLGCQPSETRPGLWLNGESVEAPVADWSFTDAFQSVFIQTSPWYGLPHSVTIWCAAQDGELFIGSYIEKKTWEKYLLRTPEATLRVNGKLYEVVVKPVEDQALTKVLDRVYTQKYDMHAVFGDDVPKWWYYRVQSRT